MDREARTENDNNKYDYYEINELRGWSKTNDKEGQNRLLVSYSERDTSYIKIVLVVYENGHSSIHETINDDSDNKLHISYDT